MRRRRVVIRHDDDKKGSGCLVGLITICTVVLLCCATIFLFMCVNSYPYTLPKNGLTINNKHRTNEFSNEKTSRRK